MPEKERKKEMSLYTKVNTDLNFVDVYKRQLITCL